MGQGWRQRDAGTAGWGCFPPGYRGAPLFSPPEGEDDGEGTPRARLDPTGMVPVPPGRAGTSGRRQEGHKRWPAASWGSPVTGPVRSPVARLAPSRGHPRTEHPAPSEPGVRGSREKQKVYGRNSPFRHPRKAGRGLSLAGTSRSPKQPPQPPDAESHAVASPWGAGKPVSVLPRRGLGGAFCPKGTCWLSGGAERSVSAGLGRLQLPGARCAPSRCFRTCSLGSSLHARVGCPRWPLASEPRERREAVSDGEGRV